MKFQAELRGANFRPAECKEALKALDVGDDIYLIRDVNNEYDANAIACYADPELEYHVGFIAKEVAEEIAPFMDDGREFTAKIHSWLSTLKPYVVIEEV